MGAAACGGRGSKGKGSGKWRPANWRRLLPPKTRHGIPPPPKSDHCGKKRSLQSGNSDRAIFWYTNFCPRPPSPPPPPPTHTTPPNSGPRGRSALGLSRVARHRRKSCARSVPRAAAPSHCRCPRPLSRAGAAAARRTRAGRGPPPRPLRRRSGRAGPPPAPQRDQAQAEPAADAQAPGGEARPGGQGAQGGARPPAAPSPVPEPGAGRWAPRGHPRQHSGGGAIGGAQDAAAGKGLGGGGGLERLTTGGGGLQAREMAKGEA